MQNDVRLKAVAIAIGLGLSTAAIAATPHHVQISAHSLAPMNTTSLVARMGLGPHAALKVHGSRVPTAHGTFIVRQQQQYRGVPVYGRSVAVEENANGGVVGATGLVSQDLAVDLASVTPRLSAAQAVAALKRTAHDTLAGGGHIKNVETKLYVYPQEGAKARLVYLTSYFVASNQPSRPTAIIDANTGKVLKRWDNLETAGLVDATGPGGNQKTGRYIYGSGGKPALKATQQGNTCLFRTPHWSTHNLNHGTSSGPVVSFTCFNNPGNPVNGGYAPANDAEHFAGVIYDMYTQWTGSPPLNFALVMNVNYGSRYENAFWNGTSMNFGDGATTFYPLLALDVAGHEISHGYTEQHSGLQYTGQSGGMNEAYSDMSGEAAQYFDAGSNDFLVGPTIMKRGGALRYMCQPSRDGRSIGNAANYRAGMDVHFSSGVYNKAFCLLAKTSGWNTKKAWRVFQLANASYWRATATFDSASCGVEQAAIDQNWNMSDVVSAFRQVGVACANPPHQPPQQQGPTAGFRDSVNGLSVSFTDTSSDPDGSIVSRSWRFGDGATSTQANPTHAYAAVGTYTVTLTVTDNDNQSDSTSQQVTVSSAPSQGPQAGFTAAANGLSVSFTNTSSDSGGSIVSRSWNFGDGATSTQTSPTHAYATGGTYSVTLSVTDDNGKTDTASQQVKVSSSNQPPSNCAIWQEGVLYNAGDVVSYQGSTYTARVTQIDWPGAGWDPADTPTLWQPGGSCE